MLPPVRRCCELLGLDPLQLANEGCCLLVVAPEDLEPALALLGDSGAAWLGEVCQPRQGERAPAEGQVRLRTRYGSERYLPPPGGELLPRIC